MYCRGCTHKLNDDDIFCDLGFLPLVNQLLDKEDLKEPEIRYPHRTLICHYCKLVQMPDLPQETVFTKDYPFFSGQSRAWHDHCRKFTSQVANDLNLGPGSRVLEIGSNDGTMLRSFRARGIPAVGIEPCVSVAQYANMQGLATIPEFWNAETMTRLWFTDSEWRADLVIANNVLAHVPDIQGFLRAARRILAPNGILSIEVAYLGSLVQQLQFDQLYAEHYSYFSINSLCVALERAGLQPVDVEFLPTHGGSIRLTASRRGIPSDNLTEQRCLEDKSDWYSITGLKAFEPAVHKLRSELLGIVLNHNVQAVGYGASAKANLLLAYLGLTSNDIEFVVDTTPAKQGKYTPGSHIPIRGPQYLRDRKPKTVFNFLWNWPQESEANIHKDCSADIVYLRPGVG